MIMVLMSMSTVALNSWVEDGYLQLLADQIVVMLGKEFPARMKSIPWNFRIQVNHSHVSILFKVSIFTHNLENFQRQSTNHREILDEEETDADNHVQSLMRNTILEHTECERPKWPEP